MIEDCSHKRLPVPNKRRCLKNKFDYSLLLVVSKDIAGLKKLSNHPISDKLSVAFS